MRPVWLTGSVRQKRTMTLKPFKPDVAFLGVEDGINAHRVVDPVEALAERSPQRGVPGPHLPQFHLQAGVLGTQPRRFFSDAFKPLFHSAHTIQSIAAIIARKITLPQISRWDSRFMASLDNVPCCADHPCVRYACASQLGTIPQ